MTKALLKRAMLLLSLPLFVATAGMDTHQVRTLCSGIIEENSWKIPVMALQKGGLSEKQYNETLNKFEAYFKPVLSRIGAQLKVKRLWSDPTVNASAEQSGSTYIINMYGGLARHPAVTQDALMLVVCHELGHHLGGAPKANNWWGGNWASNEGQADYYAGLRCLRQVWSRQDTADWYQDAVIDDSAREGCELNYHTQSEEQLCMRTSMAGKAVGKLFQSLRYESTSPRFDTPDATVVSQMVDAHPDTQCRLDTYYQGALCVHDMNVALSDSSPKPGTCYGDYAHSFSGARPRCWFKP
jgi:hypothetical protein